MVIDARERLWAWAGLVAQVAFIVSWLVSAFWQGHDYSSVKHTISDMYAVGAPGVLFLIIVLTLTGLATMLFAWLTVRPLFGNASAILLALSIYGLGQFLTVFEREGCRLADPGCTSHDQMANAGGKTDTVISSIGILLFVATAFVLARAMRRTGGWGYWAGPTRWAGIIFAILLVALVVGHETGFSGLSERILLGFGALLIALLALGIINRPEAAA